MGTSQRRLVSRLPPGPSDLAARAAAARSRFGPLATLQVALVHRRRPTLKRSLSGVIAFPFKLGAFAPFPCPMGKDAGPKSVTLDELREHTRKLSLWRSGVHTRLARKQTERVARRTARRSGQHEAAEAPPPSSKR
jgi:hypothetical protein